MNVAPVSALIPLHNGADFVAAAIESALAQTRPPLEIIVVDDGSQDGPDRVLEAYRGRIRLLRQPARGVSAARNAGIAAARGEWIGFLDHDDQWLPGKLERQLAAVENRPEVALVYGDVEFFGDENRPSRLEGRPAPRGRVFRDFLTLGNFATPSAALARRAAILEVGGFDERISLTEDIDLWLRLSARWEVEFVPGVLARYRVHAANASSNRKRLLANLAIVLEKARHYSPQEYDSVWPQVRRLLGQVALQLGRAHLHEGDVAAARRWFRRCARHPGRRLQAYAYLAASLLPQRAREELRGAKQSVFERLARVR